MVLLAVDDGTVRSRDLESGAPRGRARPGGDIRELACVEVDSRPVAVSGCGDGQVRLWDVGARRPLYDALTGHKGPVSAVAAAIVDGHPVAVTGSSLDNAARAWDLQRGRPFGPPLVGHSGGVRSVATTVVDGYAFAVTAGGADRSFRVWDLTDGPSLHRTVYTGLIGAVACVTVDGQPAAVTVGGYDDVLRLWNLTSGRQLEDCRMGHSGRVLSLASATLGGRSTVVTGCTDGTLCIWDLKTGQATTHAMPGTVNHIAIASDGALVVSAGHEIVVLESGEGRL
ncbi:hypothetical protein [Streptomyces avermitilis]|uniref:hypothetical protein n=1 Tax=Streptomyces avermitilis TaxID=33903 RepID=UPI0033B81BCA